jgi:hypothetical protein
MFGSLVDPGEILTQFIGYRLLLLRTWSLMGLVGSNTNRLAITQSAAQELLKRAPHRLWEVSGAMEGTLLHGYLCVDATKVG